MLPTPHYRSAIRSLQEQLVLGLDTHSLSFALRITDQQSIASINTTFRHLRTIVYTPHLRSAIHCLQEQLALDLDTHSLSFALRITDQQSVVCTRAIGSGFGHSQPIVTSPHL